MLDPSRQLDLDAMVEFFGSAAPHRSALIAMACEHSAQLVQGWHFAGARIGWSLRLIGDARILAYRTPGRNLVQVGLVLGARAVAAAREAGQADAATRIIDAAPRFAEGHGERFIVALAEDLQAFPELLAIKCAVPQKAPRRPRRGPRG